MPVQARDLYRRVIFRAKFIFPRLVNQPDKNSYTNDHVQRVDAGHSEVKRKENLRMLRIDIQLRMGLLYIRHIESPTHEVARDVVLFVLLVPLNALDRQKS